MPVRSTKGSAGRVVIVTGGGTGIGRSTALAFAASESHVIIVGRRAERLAKVAAEHPAISPAPADVTDPADAERVIDDAVARWGRVDVLVNNAGASRPCRWPTLTPRASATSSPPM